MDSFTLKQLRYFETLSRFGHFGRAAEACAISQPALSAQIKELEGGLGLPLFERSTRKVRLTGFGEEFAQRVRTILQSVDDLAELSRASRTGLAGRLRLGVIPTIAPYLLPRFIGPLAERHGGLDIRVREAQTQALIEELSNGRLDAAIVALPVSEPSLTELPLFEEAFVLVRHVSELGRPVPDLEDLPEMRLLLLEEGHCFRDQALALCKIGSPTPREMLDASSLSTLVQLVGAGMGLTLIPEMAVQVETLSADVTVSRFDEPAPSRTIGMVWRASSPLATQLEEIAGDVLEAVTSG